MDSSLSNTTLISIADMAEQTETNRIIKSKTSPTSEPPENHNDKPAQPSETPKQIITINSDLSMFQLFETTTSSSHHHTDMAHHNSTLNKNKCRRHNLEKHLYPPQHLKDQSYNNIPKTCRNPQT
ncbi:uncharacterized protein LOC119662190 [Teleopsis dalmanni]|uniref:uncharacterized protein LOC119662190 n=1 Tax=Teleopsis dalmanni TaxID=139649 RepID=UPI0018CD1522|nr:uncharacterized protein LOC119662190 [Teleopsis dalmanni]